MSDFCLKLRAQTLLHSMVLGLDYGELALVVGAGAVLFGPKDLPKLSRFSGKIVGWAVGYLQHARGHIQEIGGTSELARIHQEMQVSHAETLPSSGKPLVNFKLQTQWGEIDCYMPQYRLLDFECMRVWHSKECGDGLWMIFSCCIVCRQLCMSCTQLEMKCVKVPEY